MPTNKDTTLPFWPNLKAFCSECAYASVCPLVTLASVEHCEYVRAQRVADLDAIARGGTRLLAQTPWWVGDTVIRERRGHKRELELAKRHRGRRPLHEAGVRALLGALFGPHPAAVSGRGA